MAMNRAEHWAIQPTPSEDDLDLAFLGIKSGDQIVQEALDSFSESLDRIYERYRAKPDPARRETEAA